MRQRSPSLCAALPLLTSIAACRCALPVLQGVQSLEGLRFRLVDAKGQVVGRLASQIATILQVRACCALGAARQQQHQHHHR